MEKKQYIRPQEKVTIVRFPSNSQLLAGSRNKIISGESVELVDGPDEPMGSGDGSDAASRQAFSIWDD